MEERITPEQSLLLISKTIEETKARFKDNGHIMILWGVLIFTVFASQYLLVYFDLYKKFDIVWTTALFPLGAIYTFYYIKKNLKQNPAPKPVLFRTIETMGWAMGVNLLLLGLIFSDFLGDALAPVFLILFALSIIVMGSSIKFKPMFIGGILVNLIAFGSFYISRDYHGLSMMISALVGMIIPGILLNKDRKENV